MKIKNLKYPVNCEASLLSLLSITLWVYLPPPTDFQFIKWNFWMLWRTYSIDDIFYQKGDIVFDHVYVFLYEDLRFLSPIPLWLVRMPLLFLVEVYHTYYIRPLKGKRVFIQIIENAWSFHDNCILCIKI